jgi:ribosomal-protein-alanine N-acetyltransferase
MSNDMVKTQVRRSPGVATRTNDDLGADWQQRLPVLTSGKVTLRELRPSDAPSLLSMLNTEEVARLMSPPPATLQGFDLFIRSERDKQRAGRHACFAVVPFGMNVAVGIFQIRRLDAEFLTAEWGFAIGSAFWGTGLFMEGAKMVLDFAFNEIGVNRLEARAAIRNGRGNGALRKLGAVPEAILRQSFVRNGQALDQQLWSILARDWQVVSRKQRPSIH